MGRSDEGDATKIAGPLLLDPGAKPTAAPPTAAPPSAAPTAERDPAIAGSFRVGEKIASGGFGSVYRGEHTGTGRLAAVKILHPELAGNDLIVRRFEREVEVMQRVPHPGIVEVYEIGRMPDGRPYFAMELLHGQTLSQMIRARGRLPADEVIAILAPLVDALAAAHERDVIHRDIKGSNVFLAEQGGQRRVVLLDFGIAKLLDTSAPGLTASRHTVGTLACMSPEQLRGDPVDARTDVYALGTLIYRMLTGHPPFEAASHLVLHHMHLHARPPRPSSGAPVSHAVDAVVLQAMSKQPSARHAGVAELLAALRAAAGPAAGSGHDDVSQVIAVRFEARIEGDVPDGDDRAYLDLDALGPIVSAALVKRGLESVMEAGTSRLFAITRPDEPEADRALRLRLLQTVTSLARRLEERGGADPRVRVELWVHAGTLSRGTDGSPTGGDVMDLVASIPEQTTETGVLVSAPTLAGLVAEATPAGTGAGIDLLRLAAGASIRAT